MIVCFYVIFRLKEFLPKEYVKTPKIEKRIFVVSFSALFRTLHFNKDDNYYINLLVKFRK
jgi:hypothetical protein